MAEVERAKFKLPEHLLLLKLSTIAAAIDVSKRTLERWLATEEFPRPDFIKGQVQWWRRETVENWIERLSSGK